jgi:hypothetical protein
MPRPRFRGLEGKAEPASASLSPVAREYPSRALGEHLSPPHCDCSIKEQRRQWVSCANIPAFVLYNFFTIETGE